MFHKEGLGLSGVLLSSRICGLLFASLDGHVCILSLYLLQLNASRLVLLGHRAETVA